MKCPVCDSNMTALICSCGYDRSRDYAKYPALSPVERALPVSALRFRRAPKDALRCARCGGTAFTIRIPDSTRLCQSCGWSPDASPSLECTCGSRYFTVRRKDGALMCPLCSREIPLDELIALVRPAKPAPQPSPSQAPTRKHADPQPVHSLLDHYSKKAAPVKHSPAPAAKPARIITSIAAGSTHTVVLYSDGTVRTVGDGTRAQCSVHRWENITAIAAGNFHTVGLRKDGTVLATGSNGSGQCNVHKWTDIVAIAAGAAFTVGLKRDGSLLITGSNFGYYDPLKMRSVKAIAAGGSFFVGLCADGSVSTTHPSPSIRSRTAHWTGIASIAAGSGHIVGLCDNGTALAAGESSYGQCLVNWCGIQCIAAGHNHTVAVRKDGTVAAAGFNLSRQCAVGSWRDITAVAAGQYHTVGLQKNGTLVAVGDNKYGQCDVAGLSAK